MYQNVWHSTALGVYIFGSIYIHLNVKAPMLGHQSFYLTSWDMVNQFRYKIIDYTFVFVVLFHRSLTSAESVPSNYLRVSLSCPFE